MNAPIETDLLEFAARVSSEAATLTLNWFQKKDLQVELKKDQTEVTDADKAVEDYLRNAIGNQFPHDTIIGE